MSCKKCEKKTNNIVYCNDCQQQFKKDIEVLEKKINTNPNDTKLYFDLGFAYYAIEEFKKAIENYNKAENLGLKTADLYVNIGLCYKYLGKYKKAISEYNKAINLNSEKAEFYRNRAEARIELGTKSAIKDCKQAIELEDINDAYSYFLLGRAKSNLNNHEEAIKDYTKAIELNDKNTDFYYFRGISFNVLNNNDAAIKDYKKIIELDTHNWKISAAYYCIGQTYFNLEQYEDAIKNYKQAIKLNNNNADSFYRKGRAEFELKMYSKCFKDYNKAIKLNNKNPDFYYFSGMAKIEIGLYENAIKDFNKAIELNPNEAYFYYYRGIAKDSNELHKEAIRDYNAAIKLKPNYARFYSNKGISYRNLKEYDKEIENYNIAIELVPDNPKYYNFRGIAYSNCKRYTEAINDYTKAIELAPNLAVLYYNRGLSLKKLKKYGEAIDNFNKTLELDYHYKNDISVEFEEIEKDNEGKKNFGKEDINLYYKMGDINLKLNDFNDALHYYNKTIKSDNTDPYPYIKIGLVYKKQGESQKAILNFEKSISINSAFAEGYYQRGLCYEEMGEIDKAITDYTKTIELDNKNLEAYCHRGKIYLEGKKYKKALADFEKYLEINPKDMEIKYNKKLIKIILGKSNKKNSPNNDKLIEIIVPGELEYHITKIKSRTIYSPNDKLKQLQKRILLCLQTLYLLKMSIIECANIHTHSKYLLKMDIKHFFDSIPASRIDKVLEKISQRYENYSFDELKMATTVHEQLPTGACTSSHIANAAIKDIDEEILNFCQKHFVKYSRYMDDMFFSADNKNDLKLVENFVQDILSKNAMNINQAKTKYVSDNKKQVILGVLVNKETCCLPKETKRKIRAILHNYMCGKLNNEHQVFGYLSYVFNVDKAYFKILNKYYLTYKNKYNTPKNKIRLIGKVFNRITRKYINKKGMI